MPSRLAPYIQSRRNRASRKLAAATGLLGQRRGQIQQAILQKREQDFIKSQQETQNRRRLQSGLTTLGLTAAGGAIGGVAAGAVEGGLSALQGGVLGAGIGSSVGQSFATGGAGGGINPAQIGYGLRQIQQISGDEVLDLDDIGNIGPSADDPALSNSVSAIPKQTEEAFAAATEGTIERMDEIIANERMSRRAFSPIQHSLRRVTG